MWVLKCELMFVGVNTCVEVFFRASESCDFPFPLYGGVCVVKVNPAIKMY